MGPDKPFCLRTRCLPGSAQPHRFWQRTDMCRSPQRNQYADISGRPRRPFPGTKELRLPLPGGFCIAAHLSLPSAPLAEPGRLRLLSPGSVSALGWLTAPLVISY